MKSKLKWTEIRDPNNTAPYTHVLALTPFGRFLITWKGWKDNDSPTVDETPWGDWDSAHDDLEEAKEHCEKKYCEKLTEAMSELQ